MLGVPVGSIPNVERDLLLSKQGTGGIQRGIDDIGEAHTADLRVVGPRRSRNAKQIG